MDNPVTLQLCVPSESTPIKFYSENLSETLLEWYYHSVNAPSHPLQPLKELLSFLQHPSLQFSLNIDEDPSLVPTGELQLLNMVVFDYNKPNADKTNIPLWIGTPMDTTEIEMPALDPSSIALVFQSASGLLVWHSRQKFYSLPHTFQTPYLDMSQKAGAEPVVPAHLFEVLSLGKAQTTAFILGNDVPLSKQPPHLISATDLHTLYPTQLNVLSHLQTQPSSLKIAVAMCARYFSPKIRRGYFRLSIQTETMASPFYTEFTAAVPCTDPSFDQLLQTSILNFLAGYLQWNCLQKTYLQQGLALSPKGTRWMLPDLKATSSNRVSDTFYLQWDCRWPGGEARLPNTTERVVFGELPQTSCTNTPDPLHALNPLWSELLLLMEEHLLQQMSC